MALSIGLVGQKCGMTRVFQENGKSVPVTVIQVTPNRVTQKKTNENDGYEAIQITTGERRASRVNKAMAGHYKKAGVTPGVGLWEFRVAENEASELELGSEVSLDIFEAGQKVDVTSKSKGHGFTGSIKRHNFKSQRASHGNSLAHNAPGSIGQCQTPGKVFKGKKMAGQMGNIVCTVQNLELVRVDKERGALLVKGAVPGAPGGYVVIRKAVKNQSSKGAA